MRLRELTFPLLIRFRNELQGGQAARLHRPQGRFDWTLAVAYEDGRFDDAEIIDAQGQAYRVDKIFLMRPSIWRRVTDRFGHLLILPRLERRPIVRVDMELVPTRKLSLDEFKSEFRELILSRPAWWRRHSQKSEMTSIFSTAQTFSEAFNEIGFMAPAENMVYRGQSSKIVDLR